MFDAIEMERLVQCQGPQSKGMREEPMIDAKSEWGASETQFCLP